MSEKKLVVLISGSGSNLQAFIDAQNQAQLGGKLVAVFSNKAEAYGLTRAAEAGIAGHAISHKDYDSREAFDHAMANAIEEYQPDLVILAGFMRILTPEFVQKFRGKLLNIHPSLLPKYPGLHTHRRALENGDKFHGTSVHFVTEELDGGPVIAQAKLSVEADSSESDLMAAVQKLEHGLYPQVAEWFLSGRLLMQDEGIYFDGEKLGQPIIFE